MIRDRDLLDSARRGLAVCRVYQWDADAVTLGRFQKVERVLPCSESRPRWFRRPTGGKAVQHGRDLTVAIALPRIAQPATLRQIGAIYEVLVRPLLLSFRDVGIPAGIGSEFCSRINGEDCFGVATKYDLVYQGTGAKLGGCALRVEESAVLLQPSFPYEPHESAIVGYVGAWTPFEPDRLANRLQANLIALDMIVRL